MWKVVKYRPSGGGSGGALIRRYVSLRETHLRLCTFASPRRVPAGHGINGRGDLQTRRQMGVETSGHESR